MKFNARFRRSVQIELDLDDPLSTAGYIATDFVVQSFERIGAAFEAGSTQRAWRITGDYGSGKSGFALALAKAVSGKELELPATLRLSTVVRMQPVIVTGEREPLYRTIGNAIICQVPGMKKESLPQDDSSLIELVKTALKKTPGIFLVLDELGKNLEQAMMNPASADVYLLQRLAELATRSKDRPLVVLAILHMGSGCRSAGTLPRERTSPSARAPSLPPRGSGGGPPRFSVACGGPSWQLWACPSCLPVLADRRQESSRLGMRLGMRFLNHLRFKGFSGLITGRS